MSNRFGLVKPSDAWAAIESGSMASSILGPKDKSLRSIRKRLLNKKNRGEAIAIRLLKEAGLSHEREVPFFHRGKPFFMDFLVHVNERKIAVEVDGGIHDRPDIKARDEVKDRAYKKLGWIDGVLRIKVRQISMITHQEFLAMILSCKRKTITLCPLNAEPRPRGKKKDRKVPVPSPPWINNQTSSGTSTPAASGGPTA